MQASLTLVYEPLILTAALLMLGVPAPAAGAVPCRWTAPPFARVRDDARLPDLHPVPQFATGATPAVLPTTAPYVWNPVFPIDRGGRVHARGDGAVSSILTISGGGCTEAHVAVLVYSDGFVPQRGVALDYGAITAHDELSDGSGDLTSATLHSELEAPLRIRDLWISGDARSIGYRHPAGYVTDPGGRTQTLRPAFAVRDDSVELRSGYALERGGPTVEIAYLNAATNAYRPSVSGLGAAIEIPPALDETFSAYGALAYYPNLAGEGIAYRAVRYRLGAVLSLAPAFGHPYYFEFTILGDRRTNRSGAPSSADYGGVMLGIGYRLGGIP
jgi:hypothetical protein